MPHRARAAIDEKSVLIDQKVVLKLLTLWLLADIPAGTAPPLVTAAAAAAAAALAPGPQSGAAPAAAVQATPAL